MEKLHIHLISDSTGETLKYLARAVFAQFEHDDIKQYIWPLTRSSHQLQQAFKLIEKKPGIIFHTISDNSLITSLEEFCQAHNYLCINALQAVVDKVGQYLQQAPNPKPGRQHNLDYDYFKRIEAINFTIMHDDGQNLETVKEADIILVGPSRTSKTPTSIYLAYSGFKTANVPYISGLEFPRELVAHKHIFTVGLYISIDRLVEIRKNRLLVLTDSQAATSYVNSEKVAEELQEAKKFYVANGWPIIEVTNRSVEETTAKIISLYHEWRKPK